MVSLWGTRDSKRDNAVDEDGQRHAEGSHNAHERRSQDADERTRLLPSSRNDGYLDPDDPAVRANAQ